MVALPPLEASILKFEDWHQRQENIHSNIQTYTHTFLIYWETKKNHIVFIYITRLISILSKPMKIVLFCCYFWVEASKRLGPKN